MDRSKLFGSLGRVFALAALFAGLGASVLHAQSAPTPSDPTIEAARVRYLAAEWPSGERRPGFALEDLTFAGLVGAKVEYDASGVSRKFSDSAGVARVLVELAVADEVATAHATLLRHLGFVQSTKLLPTAASRGIRAGDLGYIGYGGRDGSKISWLAFVVGNLEFRVVDLDPDAVGAVDVRPIVESIAARALALPALPAGAPLPRPTIERFSAELQNVTAGESLALEVDAREPSGAAAAVDFVVGGWQQGQGYVERDEAGRWRFHATGAGKVEITLKALGRNGTTSTRTLTLEIAKS